jgi:hypothetical protein
MLLRRVRRFFYVAETSPDKPEAKINLGSKRNWKRKNKKL